MRTKRKVLAGALVMSVLATSLAACGSATNLRCASWRGPDYCADRHWLPDAERR